MTGYNTSGTGTQSHTANFQAGDIKTLIQKHGKAVFGNQEFTLKTPSATDPKLQAIVSDPSFSVKLLKGANGQGEYELTAGGKSVTITVNSKAIN